MRSAIKTMLASGAVAALAFATPHAAAQTQPSGGGTALPRVTAIVLPHDTTPQQMSEIPGAALGLLSAGLGGVPASQTYLDISQGSRTNGSLYDSAVPSLRFREPGVVPQRAWKLARKRAADAPAQLDPGLLASTLIDNGVAARADAGAGPASTIAVDESGRVDSVPCARCPGLTVTSGSPAKARALARSLGADDLLIAFARPPAESQHQLALAVVGLGEGEVVSDSTRLEGLVQSTDLAPTILDRFGIETPRDMNGQPVTVEGEADPAALSRLDQRLSEIRPRRTATIGVNLLIWIGLTLLARLVFRGRGLRIALPVLALSAVYLPLALLVTAALEPSALTERLVVGIGAPALAAATFACARDWRGFAIAAGATTIAYAVDVILGSPLSRLSLGGPNPSIGVRYFGIGNELEAVLAVLVVMGTGAAVSGWTPRATRRRIAISFATATLLAVAAFAPGRFGADVGIAIGLPAGAAVAVAIILEASRKRALLILAAPVAAVALIAIADLLLGGGAHLTRSVLQAGGLDGLGNVAERRLRLGADTFTRYGGSPVLWLCAAGLLLTLVKWRVLRAWFEGSPAAWAGFVGAIVATLVGTVANDSGAFLLMIGSPLTSACAGYAWATRPRL